MDSCYSIRINKFALQISLLIFNVQVSWVPHYGLEPYKVKNIFISVVCLIFYLLHSGPVPDLAKDTFGQISPSLFFFFYYYVNFGHQLSSGFCLNITHENGWRVHRLKCLDKKKDSKGKEIKKKVLLFFW